MVDEAKILVGRAAVDAYREAHRQLHSKPWHREVPEEHTPLLEKLVAALEEQGFISAKTDFEPGKNEILARFWVDSDLLNIQELGFTDRKDFETRATETDIEALRLKWR